MNTMLIGIRSLFFRSVTAGFILFGTVLVGENSASAGQDNKESNDLGRRVYDQNCAVCHGENGNGKGKEANRFQIKPTAFTRGEFKFKSSYPGVLPFSGDLYRSVTEGVRGTGMLAQLHLTNEERWAAVEYIKTFSKRFDGVAISLDEAIAIPDPPKKTSQMVAYGRELYVDAGCLKCHGNTGRGDGPAVEALRDNRGNPVKIPDLTKLPRKMGNSVEDLYRTLVTGLEGTPMPSYNDVLDESQLWAVVYYLESVATGRQGNCMGMMGKMMDMVGEECIGMQIDMPAARAKMMGR